jgi:4-amino-4-deoxy-L-arabinose transferase-like glycosyltransferase
MSANSTRPAPVNGALDARDLRYMLVVASVAVAAALAMVFFIFRSQAMVDTAGDPYQYGAIARGLVDHGLTKLTRRAATLYPEFIAAVYRIGGGNLTVELIQCLLHAGTCVLAFVIARRFFNARTGLLAGLVCALHPMLLRYVGDLHMEAMLTFLCTLTVWCAIRFHDRPTVANGVVLGAVGMVTTLTKGVMLPFLAVFGVVSLALALRARSGRAFAGVMAMGITMCLLLAPWTYRNYRVTGGRFVLLTPGSSDSFLRGYVFTRTEFATLQKSPYIYAEAEVNDWFKRIAREAGTEWELDEVVDEANNARVAKRLVMTQPLATIRKVVVGLFTFWYEMTTLTNSLVPGVLALTAWGLAVVGLRRTWREDGRQPVWLLLLPIVVMNVFVAALIPLGRYSAPILPCLMILAARGIDTMLTPRT